MKYGLFLIIFLSASLIHPDVLSENSFIVWNIGQGQWTTRVFADQCWHFDMGGEFFPWGPLQKICGEKKNIVFLSHWDMDHIGALRKAPKFLKDLCLARAPLGPTTPHKQALMPARRCPEFRPDWEWHPELLEGGKKASANDLSQVFIMNHWLIPGDSTIKEENIWAPRLPVGAVKFLVLGHHGSKTSSSDILFRHLPGLKIAISTARWKRYHHPHPETLARAKRYRVPVLRTEDWGSLHFPL